LPTDQGLGELVPLQEPNVPRFLVFHHLNSEIELEGIIRQDITSK
jgi:hypothetical protein